MKNPVIYWAGSRPADPASSWTFLSTEKGICRILYPGDSPQNWSNWLSRHFPGARLEGNKEAVGESGIFDLWEAYFNGKPAVFDSVSLDPAGTPFQLEVWSKLCEIPYGTVWTYRDLASAIGRPNAVRAVGTANGANPLPVLVPCHRVVGSNQTLVGYRGGLAVKEKLLQLEGVYSIVSKGHDRFRF